MSKKENKKARATGVSKQERIAQIEAMILQSLDNYSILRASKDFDWGLSDRQLYRYIEEAKDNIKKFPHLGAKYYWAKNYTKLERLYEKCLTHNEFEAALNAVREMNTMSGFYISQPAALNDQANDMEGRDPVQIILPHNRRGSEDTDPIETMDFKTAQKQLEKMRKGETDESSQS